MRKIIIIAILSILSVSNALAYDYGNGKHIDDKAKQTIDASVGKLSESRASVIQGKVAILLKRKFSKKNMELLEYIGYALQIRNTKQATQVSNVAKMESGSVNILTTSTTNVATDYKKIRTINELYQNVGARGDCVMRNESNITSVVKIEIGAETKYTIPKNSMFEVAFNDSDILNWGWFSGSLNLSKSLLLPICGERAVYLSMEWYTETVKSISIVSKACKVVGDSEYENAMDEYLKSKNFVNDIWANNGGRNCNDIINADVVDVVGKDFYDAIKADTDVMSSLHYLIVFNWVEASKKLISAVPKNKNWLYYRQFLDTHRKIDQTKLASAKELQGLVDSLTTGITDENKKIETIFNWIVDNIKYDDYTNNLYANYKTEQDFWANFENNPKANDVAFGIATYKNRMGICSGYAQLFSTMLLMSWIEDQEVKTWLTGKIDVSSKHHAWNRIGSYYYDPTWGKKWYKLTKEDMYKDRKDD